LLRRVLACWKARQRGEWRRFKRIICTPVRNRLREDVSIMRPHGFEIQEVREIVPAKLAEVIVSFRITPDAPLLRVSEPWIHEGGNWYFCPTAENFQRLSNRRHVVQGN